MSLPPQTVELQLVPDSLGELEDDFARVADELTGLIEDPAANRRRVRLYGYHLATDVLLEGLEQEERHQHRGVVRHVGSEWVKVHNSSALCYFLSKFISLFAG